MKKQRRIFIGTTEIAGYYTYLTRGFRELGYNCDHVSFYDHPFKYSDENNYFLIPFIRKIQKQAKKTNSFIIKICYLLLRELIKFAWMIYSVFRYDVYIFGFGTSFNWGNLDLILLRILKKNYIQSRTW